MFVKVDVEETLRPNVVYCHIDNICLVIEEGQIVGWYHPALSEVV